MAPNLCVSLYVLFYLLFAESGTVKGREYCKPSDSCWPTSDELENFVHTLQSIVTFPNSNDYQNASLINNRRIIEHPGMIVELSGRDDVVLSLKFAREHNIRVSIVSTGHDYDGRNSGNDTLQLSFKNMKQKSIVEFGEKKIPAIRVETGNTWNDVHSYLKANMRSKIAIGGSDPCVGVAGWALGGGHSPFSSMAGLGVDNVLAFDMVLANGSIVTADGDQNTELFWALRGGGGGTFGVVTNITFRLHDNPGPIVTLQIHFSLEWIVGHSSLLTIGKWLNTASSNISGYLQLESPPSPISAFISLLAVYRGIQVNAMKEFKTLLDLPYNSKNLSLHNDAYEYYAQIPPDYGGYSIYIFNSFLSDDALAKGNALSDAFTFVHSNPRHTIFNMKTARVCMGAILGGAVATAVESSGATAIHPGFRKARLSMTCGTAWLSPGPYPHAEMEVDDWASKYYKYGDGSYYNEPQSNLEDWKNGFWGSDETYSRLLKVKKDVDPDFLFSCHHCVGFEDVD